MGATGTVYLVGAGPGDPGLITARGLELLRRAEVLVYDRLVNARLLDEAPQEAERVYVGRAASQAEMPQDPVNALMIERARAGRTVVRLKGGDPFVFGRGGEEAEALAAAGVPFEVVPGISSAIAVPAYAGIPLTHRDYASSFLVATGQESRDRPSRMRWEHLAHGADTLVFLMAFETLEKVVTNLIEHGRAPDTPVAVVQQGTEPVQRTVVGTLGDIVAKVRVARMGPPAVVVVGEVVRLREQIAWLDKRPLFGKRVLVTRAAEQASELTRLLREAGAETVELPTIQVQPIEDVSVLDRCLAALSDYGWVIFTSANAVEVFFQRLSALGRDARAFASSRLAAIGRATAASLERHGLRADVVPAAATAEGLIEAFNGEEMTGARVLLPRAEGGRPELLRYLADRGVQVTELLLYRSVPPAESAERAKRLLTEGPVDIAVFTSSSTIKNLAAMLDGDLSLLNGTLIATIGPATSQAVRDLGQQVGVEAEEQTMEGLVRALMRRFGGVT
ncbi:MAG TPA: uroporphyrinogen-III C-methyltransferase [Dehalococcoidia bacterium]|nr:uroporphyrinogen-III C-methyltransferase [Dehalococcoidia bacterium]